MNKKQRKKERWNIITTGWPSYKYMGGMKYGKPHGKGKIIFDGPLLSIKPQAVILDHEYEGEFKKGKKDGMGTFTNYHTGYYFNKYEYVGELRDDKFQGEGSQNFPDGTKIVGQWKEGFCIKGHRIYPSGEKTNIKTIETKLDMSPNIEAKQYKQYYGLYEGETKKGKPHGKGRAFLKLKKRKHMPNGGSISWIGEWKDGHLDGKGVWIWQRGEAYDKFYYESGPQYNLSVFEGEWKKGLRHGKAIWKNVRDHIFFEGEFKDDEFYNGIHKALTHDRENDVFDKEIISIYHEGENVGSKIIYLEGEDPIIDENEKN